MAYLPGELENRSLFGVTTRRIDYAAGACRHVSSRHNISMPFTVPHPIAFIPRLIAECGICAPAPHTAKSMRSLPPRRSSAKTSSERILAQRITGSAAEAGRNGLSGKSVERATSRLPCLEASPCRRRLAPWTAVLWTRLRVVPAGLAAWRCLGGSDEADRTQAAGDMVCNGSYHVPVVLSHVPDNDGHQQEDGDGATHEARSNTAPVINSLRNPLQFYGLKKGAAWTGALARPRVSFLPVCGSRKENQVQGKTD